MLLSNIASRSEIPGALRLYEKSRKQRAETVQQSGSENRITLHLPDGPEQIARDEQFRASARGSSPDKWTDRATQRLLWGWDAEEAALEVWNGMFLRSALTCQNANVWCGVARGYNNDKDRCQSVTNLPTLLYQNLLHSLFRWNTDAHLFPQSQLFSISLYNHQIGKPSNTMYIGWWT